MYCENLSLIDMWSLGFPLADNEPHTAACSLSPQLDKKENQKGKNETTCGQVGKGKSVCSSKQSKEFIHYFREEADVWPSPGKPLSPSHIRVTCEDKFNKSLTRKKKRSYGFSSIDCKFFKIITV